jgi:MbtH protein
LVVAATVPHSEVRRGFPHPRKDGVITNPFEDPDANYLALVNEEGQYSLCPVFADIPGGWQSVFGEAGRQE